jgi:kynureninase
VTIDVPHGYEVCQALLAEDILVDYRSAAGIRVAPHFFTRDQECTAAVERIREIVATREYERYASLARRPG